jgi:hypothetical protein
MPVFQIADYEDFEDLFADADDVQEEERPGLRDPEPVAETENVVTENIGRPVDQVRV